MDMVKNTFDNVPPMFNSRDLVQYSGSSSVPARSRDDESRL